MGEHRFVLEYTWVTIVLAGKFSRAVGMEGGICALMKWNQALVLSG